MGGQSSGAGTGLVCESRSLRHFWSGGQETVFGIIVTLLVKLHKTEEKVRTGHVTKD